MSYFLKSGNTYRISSEEALDLHHKLPAGNYIIKVDTFGGMYLEHIEDFEFKGKRYGDNIRYTDRIMNTFESREASTGIMLAGEKGSGKSLLAKSLSMAAYAKGYPTIVINSPYKGDSFNKLIQDIDQPCVVLFDEFEKVYDRDDQESILTLLDGVFPSKKLFILTCNDKWRIDTHMRNRPGRIYYMIDFKGLDAAFINEYCQDNLINKYHISKICDIAGLFAEFNFDMLKALVEEMNRYGETPQEALKMLNAKPEFDNGSNYDVSLKVNGIVVPKQRLSPERFEGNPLKEISISYDVNHAQYNEPDSISDWQDISFTPQDLIQINSTQGTFEFRDQEGRLLTLTRVKEKQFNFDAF